MNIRASQQGGVTRLALSGRLDATTASDMELRFFEEIDRGAGSMVVDLSGVDYISSAGLRVLLTSAKHMQQAKGRMVLAAASPQVRHVLEMAGFGAIIRVFETTEAACTHLSPGTKPTTAITRPLNFAEELYLLALNDHEGTLKPMSSFALGYALAGALLMDLALANRIDSDLTLLKVTSREATGDALLDESLQELYANPEPHPTAYWLRQFADDSRRIEQRVLDSLIGKGLLRQENRRILWVFEVRRYPVIDDREVKEARTRLRELSVGEEIPEPRDVVLLSLAKVCGLLEDLFSAEEFERIKPRIEALSRLDLIGQTMSETIREIERTMAVVELPMM